MTRGDGQTLIRGTPGFDIRSVVKHFDAPLLRATIEKGLRFFGAGDHIHNVSRCDDSDKIPIPTKHWQAVDMMGQHQIGGLSERRS